MSDKKTTFIRPQAGFQEEFVRSNVDVVFGGGAVGVGKLMPLDTPILTPDGWVKNGDLKVGDFVCTPFGKPAEITRLFEHKDKDIYLLTTSDNRQVECGLEHLWAIRTGKQLDKFHKDGAVDKHLTVCDTKQLIERLNQGKESFIPIPEAQEFSEKEYVIPPYVMGVLIGDGCLTDKTWVFDTAFCVSNTEQDVIDKVAKLTDTTKVYRQDSNNTKKFYTPHAKKYMDYCREIGLNTYSYNKFIPEEYLWGSIEQRRQLLTGLFDTDGHIANNGSFSYSTTSPKLCEQVVYLCRSLGYIATVGYDSRTDKYTNGKAFHICIQTSDKIFTSEKHFDRWNKAYSKKKAFIRNNKHVRVKSIELVRKADARCLLVDDPMHLYIAGDFVTTHNTFAAVLIPAEPSEYPLFRALYLRNNLGDLRSGGGILDTFREAYGDGVDIVESGEPRVTFKSGATVDVTHVSDQSKDKVLQRFKGRQYDLIYFDELTGFTWECFTTICTRNRGKTPWTGKIRATTNPSTKHWVKEFIKWYIGYDGEIREDRDGKVRYFFMAGESVRDVVWGNSKEEVYKRCKPMIDEMVRGQNKKGGNVTYETFIKSFAFYSGNMAENKAMLEQNGDYIGTVAMMGGGSAMQALGNWNYGPDENIDKPIPQELAMSVFENDPQTNGDRWITADLADTGTDNFIAIAWDGFHVLDMIIAGQTTPRTNAELLVQLARKWDIADSHIIYDAVRGTYINDYLPEAMPYVSYRTPLGIYGRSVMKLKDECYMRLVEAIKRHEFSFDDAVAARRYEHANLKEYVSVEAEFLDECSVVMFDEGAGGKKMLVSKKKMNQQLGRHRSMDLLDPCAMRFMPVLQYTYGEELTRTSADYQYQERHTNDGTPKGQTVDLFDNSFFC